MAMLVRILFISWCSLLTLTEALAAGFMPRSFNALGGKAVFVDFTQADYFIHYDLGKKTASVKAQIQFKNYEAGMPIFDSVETPTEVLLNGESVSAQELSTPQRETRLRVINKVITPGAHTLQVSVPLVALVEYVGDGVRSAFWTSDLSERRFLERYLPANLEYDQVKMNFHVSFQGAKKRQVVYTNGVVRQTPEGFSVSYPKYYTASSIFYHTVPQGSTAELRFSLRSIDGREIPSVVYFSNTSIASSLERLKAKASEVFHELERDYGPYPHPSLIVLQAGMGGMEYCGATMTDFSALGHELFHFYFARGVMPANGNAGWVDEALASWRDNGYPSLSTLSGATGMSVHPYYTRTTDRSAYTFGARFMAYLDGKLKSQGGLKSFMRDYAEKRMFRPFVIEEFIRDISSFYGLDLRPDFEQFTFKRGLKAQHFDSHPVHHKMSLSELRDHL
jgi:hypothetical protein